MDRGLCQVLIEPLHREVAPHVDVDFQPRPKNELRVPSKRIVVMDRDGQGEASRGAARIRPRIDGHLGQEPLDVDAAITLGAPRHRSVPVDIDQGIWRVLDNLLLAKPPGPYIWSIL